MVKVMIADDQELIRQSLQIVLSTHEDLKVVDAVENGLLSLRTEFIFCSRAESTLVRSIAGYSFC